MNKKLVLYGIFVGFLFAGNTASAHQPRLVWDFINSHDSPIVISNPDISQAFYGILKNQPEYYKVKLDKASILYLSLLVPDNINAGVDISARVFKLNSPDSDIKTFLNGKRSTWESYYEEFAGDFYLQGPENSTYLKEGEYLIEITSEKNEGKYVLVVGQKESFPLDEAMRMIINLPRLKIDFFEEPVFMLAGGIIGKLMASLLLFLLLLALMSLRKRRERKG
ncbi:MAG: hypothetical protein WC631_03760 [Candidatus Paceibacterota bacterium]|jgi:hypothetical protein